MSEDRKLPVIDFHDKKALLLAATTTVDKPTKELIEKEIEALDNGINEIHNTREDRDLKIYTNKEICEVEKVGLALLF